jgi:hypothetical protein
MSDPDRTPPVTAQDEDEAPSPGPNLVLIYSLIALAFLAALGVAALIVLPYYRAR